MPAQRTTTASFLPKVDAGILRFLRQQAPLQQPRPTTIGPIFDPDNLDKPISALTPDIEATVYPHLPSTTTTTTTTTTTPHPHAPTSISTSTSTSTICDIPAGFDHHDRYLRAFLADNERLRLSMLWYYTRGIEAEDELLAGLQEKADLAKECTGWQFSVIGILDIDVYIRLATHGLQLGILPRGETLCAHTVTQPPGSVFLLPDLQEDWRFRSCPYLEQGGLYAYAGVPLRLQHESGVTVGLGSLCVTSSKAEDPLTKDQQQALVRLADWVVSDLVQCTRARRQRERQRMSDLLTTARMELEKGVSADPVFRILKTIYPKAVIKSQLTTATHVEMEARNPILMSDLEGGLWEDIEYLDTLIAEANHQPLPTTKTVRVMAAPCESANGPALLMVGSKDFQHIFDDVDSWFVQSCAGLISQLWRNRLLAEAINAKEKFLRGISHQLRTPIHGILGSADLLAEELQEACGAGATDDALVAPTVTAVLKTGFMGFAEYSKYLNIIKMGGRDLIAIVNNMITLNRWVDIALTDRHYAMHSIDKLETELRTAISALTIGDMRYSCALFFTHDVPPGFETFWMDIDVLRDSLLPIVYNAIQHTPDGIVSVHSTVDPESKQLTIDIRDTGRGIQQDDQRRIFEAYEKVDAHSARAGLGLTLASRFATLLHGSVALMSSAIGRGSHFRATFRDLEYACNADGTPPSLASTLKSLPRSFYILKSPTRAGSRPRSPGLSTSLTDHFASILTRSGFTPSHSLDHSFVIVDAPPDTEEHHTRLSQIPAGTVCISVASGLPADSEAPVLLEPTSAKNVIHTSGPFSAQTLASVLERADALAAEITPVEPSNPPLSAPIVLPMHLKQSNDDDSASDSDLQPDSNTLLTPGESSSEETTGAGSPGPSATRTSSRPTTLIVDDNIVNLRIMEMYCQKRGLPHLTATDGLQAVETFRRRQSSSSSSPITENEPDLPPIELIFMDLQMPVCDGVNATRQIRALEQENDWARALVIVMTGQDTLADKTAAEDAGGDEYFVKPVILRQLDGVLRRHFPAFEGGWGTYIPQITWLDSSGTPTINTIIIIIITTTIPMISIS
ncbi:hypothetical protein BO82DRAFT_389010 [Aspergillus uvarum CBS 121591]|uniref:histidine kinase n=1 Tax=Aspergillus uvarum CBS 121591 TaxID=1448315 RepID=A0A319CJM1_9EURO|nr:hypothetical protein BO82DRAFT_389010 [Aspergillus uvarum CBS 121591]PYH85846.1 hypothetical protein BO82DRAFT_389010 [Aspergillus uvarum CBS 121591]